MAACNNKMSILACMMTIGALAVTPAFAGVTYKDGDKFLKLGGRIQMQYHLDDPDAGNSTDELFFRRLRPYIEGSVHPDWTGKFQWDMGEAKLVSIKDAYMEYKGFNNMAVTIGNAYTKFSREALTSSKKQQLVERTFVGDHNYGSPDRNLGLHLTGHNGSKGFTWAVDFAEANIDPDSAKVDFDTPVNGHTDFNQGWMANGRVEFYPLGFFKMSQGDFKREQKLALAVAAFNWSNDDDNNTRTSAGADTSGGSKPDVDSVTGVELSAAYRNAGFSVDAEYNSFDADTTDPAVTSGVYKNGSTTLENWAVEGGYMIVPATFEIVAGYQSQDSDGYTDTWTRTSVGANWFVHGHDIKYQLTYRQNQNIDGAVANADGDELFFQAQYVF